jgi:hypothetical protein
MPPQKSSSLFFKCLVQILDTHYSRSDEERRHCKKYSVSLESFVTIIDIPPELDGPDDFHPTLGQKVNQGKRKKKN